MMDLSASGSPWLPSAIVAPESARNASILKARCAAGGCPATSARSKGLRQAPEPGPSFTETPPLGTTTLAYSPAGSKMTTWSSLYARIVFSISRFTEKDLPLPGLPDT
jgi:hypothetical protein